MTADRRPFVAGNWKMNLDRARAADLAAGVAQQTAHYPAVDVAVFPAFVHLDTVAHALKDAGDLHAASAPGWDGVALGAQDAYHQPDGAFTGEVSIAMLTDLGVSLVLAGHSERRHVIGETDELVNAKVRATLDAGLTSVLCIGEKLDEREAGRTDEVNERQLRAGLDGVDAGVASERLVIAYEPVWAIGTGKTATPGDAQAAHERVRSVLSELLGGATAEAVRIQYGGSMKPANAGELMAQADIDGGLIGGASLEAGSFASIVEAGAALAAG